MKISELGFADLIALRDHAVNKIFEFASSKSDKETDKQRARRQQEVGHWGKVKKLVAKEIHERTKEIIE